MLRPVRSPAHPPSASRAHPYLPGQRLQQSSADQDCQSHAVRCFRDAHHHHHFPAEWSDQRRLQFDSRFHRRNFSLHVDCNQRNIAHRIYAQRFHRCDHRHTHRQRHEHTLDLPGQRFQQSSTDQDCQSHAVHCFRNPHHHHHFPPEWSDQRRLQLDSRFHRRNFAFHLDRNQWNIAHRI